MKPRQTAAPHLVVVVAVLDLVDFAVFPAGVAAPPAAVAASVDLAQVYRAVAPALVAVVVIATDFAAVAVATPSFVSSAVGSDVCNALAAVAVLSVLMADVVTVPLQLAVAPCVASDAAVDMVVPELYLMLMKCFVVLSNTGAAVPPSAVYQFSVALPA